MIDKISKKRGRDPVGLVLYLFGPGKNNEHTDPYIVAADVTLGVPDGHRYSDKREIIDLGHDINSPHKLYGTEFPGGHVWHCSLSNPNGDRELSGAEWAEIARAAMDRMGFTETSGKAPCRWIAVRHGLSVEGNDHIHLVVNLIRDDGTKATIWNDRRTMSRLMTEVEHRFGLTVVEGRAGAGLPGISLAEKEIAKRKGRPEPDRTRLARSVRSAAVASADEAEFVRRLRTSGVLARPRYATGGRDEVVGYSVALRPAETGEKPVWFGGGRLAPDLTLTRLRTHWPEAAESRQAALEEWSEGSKTSPGREARALRAEAWAEAEEQINGVIVRLAEVDPADWETWAGVAREASGVYAALSARLEGERPGLLARAAEALSRSAQSRFGQPRARRIRNAASAFRGVQMVAIQAGPVGRTAEGEALLIQAMFRIVRLVHDSHVARGEATQAARLADLARGELATLHQTLTAGVRSEAAQNESSGVEQSAQRPLQWPVSRPDRDLGR